MTIPAMTTPSQEVGRTNPAPGGGAMLGHMGPCCVKAQASGINQLGPQPDPTREPGVGRGWPGNSTRPPRTLRAMLVWAVLPSGVENKEITRSVEKEKV